MRHLILLTFISFSVACPAQQSKLNKSWMIKSNLLSLVAQRPTLAVEKGISHRLAAEISYAEGEFDNIFLTEKYTYSGILIRLKQYFTGMKPGHFDPFFSFYAGNLKRTITSSGADLFSGWYYYAGRNFSANSIRAGLSTGVTYFSAHHFMLESQLSLGYGRYTKVYSGGAHPGGYPDVQIALAIGYCF